jgi:hypothetical protein
MSKLGIGELSAKSGVAVPNIRYYESIGLLPRPNAMKADDAHTPTTTSRN